MKCKVLASFRDIYDHDIRYNAGDILEWDDEARIKNCVGQGLIEVVKEKPKKTQTKKSS